MNPVLAVLVDAAVWAGWGTAVGWIASRVRTERLRPARTRPWERAAYERLGVRRWKDRLPEAGAAFGGPSKRRLPGRSRAHLCDFARESRRAELVHWIVPIALVVFPLWNPWWITAVMAAYATIANGPCVVVARYNASRIAKLVPC